MQPRTLENTERNTMSLTYSFFFFFSHGTWMLQLAEQSRKACFLFRGELLHKKSDPSCDTKCKFLKKTNKTETENQILTQKATIYTKEY